MIFRVPENRNILTENRPKFRFGNRTEPKPKFTNRTEPKTENLQTDPPLINSLIWPWTSISSTTEIPNRQDKFWYLYDTDRPSLQILNDYLQNSTFFPTFILTRSVLTSFSF